MNLKEIREMVASLVDYDPDVRAYRQEVNRILNETYRNWFVSRPYEFAQKTVDVYSMPDGTIPSATITSSTTEIRNWVQASALDATDSTEVGFVDKFRNAEKAGNVVKMRSGGLRRS